MANSATRLITLLMLLQSRPNQKAADLAEKLGVSVRTLHRYIGMLDEMGIPVYTERGPYGGFSLVRGYKMPPLALTPEEAVAVSLGAGLATEVWGPLYGTAAQGALAKLDNLLPDVQRQEVAWARRSLVATGMHRSDMEGLTPHLALLRRAAHEHRRIRMVYRSQNSTQPQSRSLDPYALVHRWGWWYVFGYCHLRQGVRSFRVDRIVEIGLTEEPFPAPDDFDLQDYLDSEWQEQGQIKARVRFVPQAAHIAQVNRSYWDALEEQPDGSVIVTMSAPDLNWAASNALVYGPLVTVLDPPELRQLLRDWAAAVANQYSLEEKDGSNGNA
jgi:predicted DNA-binding transcriptional regulator YafY